MKEVTVTDMEDNKKLFVANLAPGVTEGELAEQFSFFGRVRFVRIIEDKRIAFVKMFDSGDAYEAKLGLNGIELHGQRIWVEEAYARKKKTASNEHGKMT
jgi:RNA recognition motif-containing protein